jgi:hypothetical protein
VNLSVSELVFLPNLVPQSFFAIHFPPQGERFTNALAWRKRRSTF